MKNTMLMRAAFAVVLAAMPVCAGAQQPVAPPTGPPAPAAPPQMAVGPQIQRITTASAVSKETFGAITNVRELPDGRVLLNDGTRRRLLVLDTTLTPVEVVLDSMSEVMNTYGPRAGALVPFRGDSTLFIDPASFAMVVIDAAGKPTRIRSVWRVQDVPYFTSATGLYGFPGVDAKGRVVYRKPAVAAPPAVAPPAGVPYFPPQPDSAFIVAANIDTRKIDTLAVVAIPKTGQMITQMREGGGYSLYPMINPLPAQDHWAVLPDGTVAITRWRDYRVDYIKPDGTMTSSQKLPYEWQRMTDELKEKMVDSVLTVQKRQAHMQWVSEVIMWSNQYNQPYPKNFTVPEGYTLQPGFPSDWILPPGVTFPANYIYACPPGTEAPSQAAMMNMVMSMSGAAMGGAPVQITTSHAPPGAPAAPGAAGAPAGVTPAPANCFPAPPMMMGSGFTPPLPTLRNVGVMPPNELPDYKPPFPTSTTGAIRADMEGNLWIRFVPAKPIPGGVVYDIVSREGELVNRIQLPPGYTLLGFGKDKVVYLSMRDQAGLHLARVRLR